MTSRPVLQRPGPRTTALGALVIFVPLFAVLLWWAFSNRVAPISIGETHHLVGTLSARIAIAAAAFTAAGPAVFLALMIAIRDRLPGIFRARRGRVIAAAVLFLLAPARTSAFTPLLLPGFALTG